MNILVVGGAGFIGSHTCYILASKGYTPIVYDNFSSGYKDLIAPFPYVEGDIADIPKLTSVLQEHNIEAVLHFAAYISVNESVKNPLLYYENNVSGTISLLHAVRNVGIQYIVLSSTAAVYGNPTSYTPLTEEHTLSPMSPYASSKYMMESIAQDCSIAHGLCFASLRYFNAAGADAQQRTGQRCTAPTHIIPRLFLSITGDAPHFSLYGTDYPTPDGTCIRDYIHVTDLAIAHVQALEYLKKTHRNIICNLGTNIGTSNRELISIVESVTGKRVPVQECGRREGDPDYVVADASKAFASLAWKPEESSLEHIVHTAWEWFMKDRERRHG